MTLSIVDTWVPSSIVCKVKSISGTGFLSVTARTSVLSMVDMRARVGVRAKSQEFVQTDGCEFERGESVVGLSAVRVLTRIDARVPRQIES